MASRVAVAVRGTGPAAAPAPSGPPPSSVDEGLLLSLVTGLGSFHKFPDGASAFVADEDALACLLDLQRLLRRDEPERRETLCRLAAWNTLEGKVLPLLVGYASNFELLFNSAKVRAPPARPGAV